MSFASRFFFLFIKRKTLPRQVIGSTPRRRQKDDVGGGDVLNDVEEVSNDELDPIRDAVDRRVVTREGDLLGVDVDGDHTLAGEGKLRRGKEVFKFNKI